MGRRTYLVEGVSGTGKTTVCAELRRRGLHAVHGDRELAYQGDPATGEPTDTSSHHHHIWDVERVRALAEDSTDEVTFLCGGSRNVAAFRDLLDGVLVLRVDAATLGRRLDERDPAEFGHADEERALVMRLHRTHEDVPDGVNVDATRPVGEVVDEILRLVGLPSVELVRIGPDDWRELRAVRLASLADAPEAFGARLADWEDAPEGRWRARLGDVPLTVVARRGGESVGVVSGMDADGAVELISMWVAPEERGTGLAGRLIAQVVSWAQARGRRTGLMVFEGNAAAIRAYERAGFVDHGVPADQPAGHPAERRMWHGRE